MAFGSKVQGPGQYLKLDYLPSAASNELQVAVIYTLWIPDGVKTLRGIIVNQHGAGTTASIEGSTAAYDLHWRAQRFGARVTTCGTRRSIPRRRSIME